MLRISREADPVSGELSGVVAGAVGDVGNAGGSCAGVFQVVWERRGFIAAFPHDGSFHSPVLCSCGATRLGTGCEQPTVWVVAAEQIEAVVDSDRSVEVLANEHATLGHTEAEGLSLNLKLDLAEGHDVVVADHSVVMFGEHLVEV